MTKLNISMPQQLLDAIDAEAEALGISRSGLIQEASARYVVSSQADRQAELRRLRVQAAAEKMRRFAGELGPVDDTAQLVAEARAEEGGRRD